MKNTWKKTGLIILTALISASILFATCYCSTSAKATCPTTYLTAMDTKASLSNIMYLKNDTSLYNTTYSVYYLYTCELDLDAYPEALAISLEHTTDGISYYNLTVINLGPTPSVKWSQSITPSVVGWPTFTLHLLNISDFDRDNENEIAIAYYYSAGGYYTLSVYNGDGTLLRDLTQFWQECQYGKLVVVDWNSDGVNDILSVYWASNNFNVTFVKDVTSGECESKLYSYPASSCNVNQLVAGNFNSTSPEPELALSCYTGNYKILIISDDTVKQCFENSSYFYYLYSTGEHLIFGSYYYSNGYVIILLGAYLDSVLWNLTQNTSSGESPICVVADFDLDLEPEIFYKYYEPTGRTYYSQQKYVVVDLENGQKTKKDYMPVPVSFENDWKLLVGSQYGQYSTLSIYENPSSSSNMIMAPRFMSISQTSLIVLDKNYVSVSGFFPRTESSGIYSSMLCFEDYDRDGRLEALGVGSKGIALLELEPVPLLSMNVVYLEFYAFFSAHQGVNNGYFYLSVSLLVIVVGLTMFYYIRRRTIALEFDRQIRTK
ncbi:MAG: hypothetical protein QW279_06315 [Candidatus Jordarchaeaceae archaeon]